MLYKYIYAACAFHRLYFKLGSSWSPESVSLKTGIVLVGAADTAEICFSVSEFYGFNFEVSD